MEKSTEKTEKKTPSSQFEKALTSTFPRICEGCSQLTNKQFFLIDPLLKLTTIGTFIKNANSNFVLSKIIVEDFYEGEIYLLLSLKQAITIGNILLLLDDEAIKENASKENFDADCADGFKEFSNQVCGILDNDLRLKLPKPIHLKLLSVEPINKENMTTVLKDEILNEECLFLTSSMRISGFDDDQFIICVPKLIGEEFFGEIIEEANKEYRGTILAVDDSNTDLRIVRKLLGSDFKVLVTDNPNNALSLIGKTHIDLVLMDIYMPGVDGITLCERIKRNAMVEEVPIIICSAHPTQENVIRAVRAGAADFIVKPVSRQKLIEKINKHMLNKNLKSFANR
ncbi:MAG: response regulator [Candidatus Kuenenia sp.]|nr:response regulator [Candidatus Kuenenia hertensis]